MMMMMIVTTHLSDKWPLGLPHPLSVSLSREVEPGYVHCHASMVHTGQLGSGRRHYDLPCATFPTSEAHQLTPTPKCSAQD
jgi:hypothetical protein